MTLPPRIETLLADRQWWAPKDVAAALDAPYRSVMQALSRMVAAGRLRTRPGAYRVAEMGREV